MINQKEKVLNVLSEGREVTAKQLSSQFGIGSPTKVISFDGTVMQFILTVVLILKDVRLKSIVLAHPLVEW